MALGYTFRKLRRSPVYTVTAIFTLALGIGASTAIFSVTNAVLLQPLPYRDAERLVLACRDFRKTNARDVPFSNADFYDLANRSKVVFEDLGAVFTFRAFVPREDGSAEQIIKAQVTTNLFRLLGATVALGRDFTAADGLPQPNQPDTVLPPGSVAILSYEYWQRRYGGDTSVLGREMLATGQRGPRIVGVLTPGFTLLLPPTANIEPLPEVWIANNAGYDAAHRGLIGLRVIGKLKPGVAVATARQEIAAHYARQEVTMRLEPMQRYLVTAVRQAILSLMGAVLFLWLIACANIAHLLLVEASLRERETAMRTALGAGWVRLTWQALAESLTLAAFGTAAGVALASVGIRELVAIAPANLPRLESIGIDWRVAAFAALAGVGSAALFGVAPAFRMAHTDVVRALRGSNRNTATHGVRLFRNAVVIVEVALSFVLLIGSGLMLRSFVELQRIDTGYDARGLLTLFVARDWPFSRTEGRLELLGEIQRRLRALPGVENVTASIFFPLTGGTRPALPWNTDEPRSGTGAFKTVMPGYFETLRTPLLAGRTFTEADNLPGRNLVVIDQMLAARAFPNQPAVGRRIHTPFGPKEGLEVIGVVGHQRDAGLVEAGREQVYLTEALAGAGVARYWAIRASGDPASLIAAVRAEIAHIDRQLVITKMQPMRRLIEQEQAATRFSLLLIGVFAVVAAVLAAVGLYGVVASVVRRRTSEIGVRMALGATPAGIFQLVVAEGLRLSAVGIAIGVITALAVTRLITSMPIGVRPADPVTFAGTAVLFVGIAAAACWMPARRAAGLDPGVALREE